jgi:AcrR family transcriptional regulator
MDLERNVLDASLAIIATDGPDALSMREVARRAGVSHQAPYHYFGDRAGIFGAITEEGFDMLTVAFRHVLASSGHPSRGCFESYVQLARSHPGHFRVMFRADICGLGTHSGATRAADESFEELLNLVDRVTNGEVDRAKRHAWASLLWSTAHGLATLLIDGPLIAKIPGDVTVDGHIEDVLDLMTQMVDSQAAMLHAK